MGKIADALEKYQEDKKEPIPIDVPKRTVVERVEIQSNSLDQAHIDEQVEKQSPSSSEAETKAESQVESDNIDTNMVALLEPRSFEAEQFKILRTKLLFPASGKPVRTLMVTSAVPGEGKSFVAANLAVSIAQNIHEHVLIIDCDMRMPCIHKRFGFGKVPGLSEYLSSRTPIESLMLKTKVDKLSLLPAGEPPDNPSELLSSQIMSDFLKEVKDRYSDRYIIIDSPPPKLTAETYAISRQVDGILLVVKHGDTPRKMVSELIETIGKEKILGVVYNNLDMRLTNYLGYNKYGNYGKRGRYYTKYHK
ncbi:MAG: polysaccharide biosynthesis tyrosine autokinase [Calditrichia bacterium]